jgi:hypothetical protein
MKLKGGKIMENFDEVSFYDLDPYYDEDGESVFDTDSCSESDGYISAIDNFYRPERFYI